MQLQFKRTKITKGAVRFDETDADGQVITSANKYIVGGLYIRKHALVEGDYPDIIFITLQFSEK